MNRFRRGDVSELYKNFQQHHIIPIAVLNHAAFKSKFESLEQYGFSPHDFTANGILLPCTESAAQKYKLPLHRGPHRHYNDLVFECVSIIFSRHDLKTGAESRLYQIVNDLSELQASLKAMLRQGRALIFLNSYDPNGKEVSLRSQENICAEFIKLFETDIQR
jgi:hypothetical protein